MKNYKTQEACINCVHSRVAPAVPLYCSVDNNYPTTKGKYDTVFFEKIRVYEKEHRVEYNGVCDLYLFQGKEAK